MGHRAHPWIPMPGCVFEYYGRIPESLYAAPEEFKYRLEQAVFNNDTTSFDNLVKEGELVAIHLKIGETMTCLEYAAMKGYVNILKALIEQSVCRSILNEYFALDDMVERSFLLSRNKSEFFERGALIEANRYTANVFTAIVYNQLTCLELMLSYLKPRDLGRHTFSIPDEQCPSDMSACELAMVLGHVECLVILGRWSPEHNCIEDFPSPLPDVTNSSMTSAIKNQSRSSLIDDDDSTP